MNPNLKKLLLHICCAPDAAVVVERLRTEYDITGFFYNPNIHPQQEYQLRVKEMERVAFKMSFPLQVGTYDADHWFALTKGLEELPEGGERCKLCFQLRLETTARFAANSKFDLFTTVLTVSPHKKAALINKLGKSIAEQYRVLFLEANFKKRDGFKRSLELSKLFNLYRQDYCGCVYSKQQGKYSKLFL